jgi:hypothetical protein
MLGPAGLRARRARSRNRICVVSPSVPPRAAPTIEVMETTLATARASSRPHRVGLLALILSVAALAAAGMALSAALLKAGAPAQPVLPAGPFATAEDIPTSFGFVAVEYAERLKGLTAKDLAGAVHGINGYVPPNKVQVQASTTLTNLTEEPVAYSPGQFELVAAKDVAAAAAARRGVAPVSSSVKDGRLQPDAAVDARLSFVVPRNDKRLFIRFTDPGRAKPVVIDLKRSTGRTPKGALQQHLHNFKPAK